MTLGARWSTTTSSLQPARANRDTKRYCRLDRSRSHQGRVRAAGPARMDAVQPATQTNQGSSLRDGPCFGGGNATGGMDLEEPHSPPQGQRVLRSSARGETVEVSLPCWVTDPRLLADAGAGRRCTRQPSEPRDAATEAGLLDGASNERSYSLSAYKQREDRAHTSSPHPPSTKPHTLHTHQTHQTGQEIWCDPFAPFASLNSQSTQLKPRPG